MAKASRVSSTRPPRGPALDDLSLGERVCLALIDAGVNHGWAIGTELAPDGPMGRVWSLSRPLTYRAIEQLTAKGLVRGRPQHAGGRDRTILGLTPAGRALAHAWLAAPVAHVRDVRTELLLKLELRSRSGLDNRELLQAQRDSFAEHFDVLTTAGPGADVVELWRRESARAVRRFLDAALGQRPVSDLPRELRPLPLSARNQLRARVAEVTHGEVMSIVRLMLSDGQRLTGVITKDSAIELDVAPDDEVLVVIKSTELMIAKP